MIETKRNKWNSEIRSRVEDDTGKIVKNSPGKSSIDFSPRLYNKLNAEKGLHWSEVGERPSNDDF